MTSAKKDRAIAIRVRKDFRNIEMSGSKLRRLIKAVCNRFAGAEPGEAQYEIGLAIVDDGHIRELNGRFLNRKATTDCLSFDLSDQDAAQSPKRNVRAFEIIVNGEMAARQAALRGHPGEAELALYVTHGLLHQLGFDDATDDDARTMHDAEDEILQQLGYGIVYNAGIRAQGR
jgi:probable rRNA maturation factor